MPSDLASRHNTRCHTSIHARDTNVDRRLRRRLSLLRNMRDGSSPGLSYNSLRSLLPRTGLKAQEAAESLASIWFLFHSHLLFGGQKCSSSQGQSPLVRRRVPFGGNADLVSALAAVRSFSS